MHPLDSSLDTSFHHSEKERGARRRTSLDCSASLESVRTRLYETEDSYKSPLRRLSLNNNITTTTLFLAGKESRPKCVELDMDFHASTHSHISNRISSKHSGSHETQETLICGSGDDSESSLESECDSFCDASVEAPANKEYLRKDLGASCWLSDGSIEGLSFDEINGIMDGDIAVIEESPDDTEQEQVEPLPRVRRNPIRKLMKRVRGLPTN